jgi:chemotaxis protein CheX
LSAAANPDAAFRMRLTETLDLRAAAPLARDLLAARGHTLAIDAGEVRRLGGLCLQVLLSADLTWARDGVAMRIEAPSPAFCEAVSMFGAGGLTARFSDRGS